MKVGGEGSEWFCEDGERWRGGVEKRVDDVWVTKAFENLGKEVWLVMSFVKSGFSK